MDESKHAGGSVSSESRAARWRLILFAVVFVAYVIVTLGVIFRSPLLDLDHAIKQLHLQRRFHGWYPRIAIYVMLGQRGPSTLVALPWIAFLAWRQRSPRPLVLLGTALLVLNLSVGVVKVLTGRIGPLATQNVHDVFAGGNIYPSGHVSNTVVLYGVLAMLATRHRRFAIIAGTFITVTVGLCTLYLNTHWFTDVLGGWLAGCLVVIALPWVMPYAERLVEAVLGRVQLAHRRRRAARVPRIDDESEVLSPDDALPSLEDAVRLSGGVTAQSAIPVLTSSRRADRRTISAR